MELIYNKSRDSYPAFLKFYDSIPGSVKKFVSLVKNDSFLVRIKI